MWRSILGHLIHRLRDDETTATYKKSMNGTPHIDGNTNQQLTFKNVLTLKQRFLSADEVGHKNLDWDGGPESIGEYISKWSGRKSAMGK